jgi:probable rRNA maturation factor
MEGIKLDHAEVNLFIVADDHMRRFNARYRKLNVPTDVLSFASSGDILVSLGRLKSQAQAHGHGLEREGAFLFAHGLLHLAGYDHATELQERVMLDVQSRILDRAGYSR